MCSVCICVCMCVVLCVFVCVSVRACVHEVKIYIRAVRLWEQLQLHVIVASQSQ